MESEDCSGREALKAGDLATFAPYSWGADDVLLVVEAEYSVHREPMVTVLYDGELLEFRPWKLRKVQ